MRKAGAFLGVVGAVLLITGYVGVTVQAAGQPATKVGIVDLQKTLDKTKLGKKKAGELEAEKSKKQKQLDKKKAELDAAVEDFKKQRPVLKPEAARARQAELEEKAYKYQEEFMQFQQELMVKEREATRDIFKAASKIIESVAKRDGYTIIIEKNEGAVLWADSAFDITDEINKRLDAGEGAK
jgi:outer membrane protein